MKPLSEKRKASQRKYRARRTARNRELGVCNRCGGQRVVGLLFCEPCLVRARATACRRYRRVSREKLEQQRKER